jgi:hypothetical protein
MGWLYRILDVGRGIELAIEDVGKMKGRGSIAVVLFMDALLCIVIGWAWWHYDLYSTWQWASPLGEGWGQSLPDRFQPYNQWLIFILNAAPTLVQWRFPRLARRHDAYLWFFLAAALFDMVTDYPQARGDVDTYLAPFFNANLGDLLAPLVLWISYLVATVIASFVLQSLFAIQATRVVALFFHAGDSRGGRTARVVVD